MNKTTINKEFDYICKFIDETEYADELFYNQIRSLWTAFCFHSNIDVDTHSYDAKMLIIWNKIIYIDGFDFLFDDFDNFMCEYLV